MRLPLSEYDNNLVIAKLSQTKMLFISPSLKKFLIFTFEKSKKKYFFVLCQTIILIFA